MEDEPVDMIDGDNLEEEDSQVKGMSEMAYDSPGDSFQGGTNKGFPQGQSVDGMPNGTMENGQGIQEVPPTANQSHHPSGSARVVADGDEIFPEVDEDVAAVPGMSEFTKKMVCTQCSCTTALTTLKLTQSCILHCLLQLLKFAGSCYGRGGTMSDP